MSKQDPSKSLSPGLVKGILMGNRYYVQHLTEQIFVVRECTSVNGTPGADDRIVRSFDILHDASMYVNSLNETSGAHPGAAASGPGKLSEK